LSFFTTSTNIDALAKKIIPEAASGVSAEQKTGIDLARQQLKDNFLNEVGIFINSGLNDIFTKGIPVATDGGAALQIAWKLETAT